LALDHLSKNTNVARKKKVEEKYLCVFNIDEMLTNKADRLSFSTNANITLPYRIAQGRPA
jgi:hypothetical protein